jgi:hypothetical protein
MHLFDKKYLIENRLRHDVSAGHGGARSGERARQILALDDVGRAKSVGYLMFAPAKL